MFDVIVVGAGPTGLFLASELRLYGLSVVVLEALAQRSPFARAGGIQPRTAEILDQRGVLEPLLATGDYPAYGGGHFAGLSVDFRSWGSRQPARIIVQDRIEEFLERRLANVVRREHRLVSVVPADDHVTAVVDSPQGTVELRGRYLVAADGAHSAVRKTLGIEFPGRDSSATAVAADVRMTGPALSARRHAEVSRASDGRWGMIFELREGEVRLALGGGGHDRQEPVTAAEVRDAVAAIFGDGNDVHEVIRAVRIGDAARQVENYRHGRVFLAGDAAHVHLPMGGQGLNLGVQDAANLGWKLARGDDELLDTYSTERHPVAARVLQNTQAQSLLVDFAGTGTPDLTAMRAIFQSMLDIPETMHFFAGMLSGLDLRYEMPDQPEHPLLGRRIPDVDLRNGMRAHELLRSGNGLLLGLAATDHTDISCVEDVGGLDAELLLVRPDGYVCATSFAGLDKALARWFPTTQSDSDCVV
ncbi:FAD-dependent monooxygenase [Fodinicola acaciae]|uniref:FAD-dependent monooxygenase n=1 Tax=Fodinicola acaciae TaxID=2681555 RepID=UPI0013D262EC|nr:FAD-dependent monooxygenase [Fodinicola acaciae]